PKYDCMFTDVPYVEAVAVWNEEAEQLTIFAVNRNVEDALVVECDVRGFDQYRVVEHLVLESDDPYAVNSLEAPDRVMSHNRGNAAWDQGIVTAALPKLSWNVIRLEHRA